MKSLSSKTYQCGVTIQGLTTLAGTTYLTGITNTTSWEHVIVGTTAQGQIYTRTYAQFMTDVATGIGLSGYVPTSRTLSINGVTYDLTANRSWTITTPYVSKLQHSVKAGVAINKGQAVYVTSADGTNMIVGLASNASEATSSKTMGLLDATVVINGFANVVTEGLLAGLDTSTAGSEGDPVWLGTGGNLIYGLANKPYAPAHLVFIGIVTRKNINNGEIFVKVQNGFELKEIHDVDLITTAPINGHLLGYDGTLWVNKTIAGWLGYTPANASGTTNYLSKFTGSTTLGDSKIVDNGSNIQFLVNSQNANSKFYMSPVHGDGRINLNAVSGGNDVTLIRAWHDSNQLGLGTGSSAGGGALTTRGDSVLIGTSGSLLFMNGTFGPNNVPYRLGISASATVTYFSTGVNNNLTNIESNAFQYTAKSHTFYTGTTAGNQSEPNQYTPLFLSTAGNVVVGSTTDSGYKLEVKNTSGSSALRISNNNDGSGMRFGISNGANSQYLDLNYWVTLQAFAGYSMNLSVGSAYGVYLDSSNNVGIGTNAPAYKMHVAGSLGVVTPGNASGITMVGNSNHDSIFKLQNTDSTSNTFGLRFETYSDGGSNRIVDLVPFNSTGTNFQGVWNFNSRTVFSAGIQNNYWSNFDIVHINSNAGQAIRFFSVSSPSGSGTPIVSFVNTGNVLIGTTTDSGYKLDVNGTARINSSLYVTDSAYTGAGRLFQSANNTFVVTGGPGGGSENITFGPSNRIFINAAQTRFISGSVQMVGTLSLGNGSAVGNQMLWVTGSITASSAAAKAIGIDTTLVAAANNDVLVGLDVNPSFNTGAFTGVTNIDLRTNGTGLVIGSGVGYGAVYGYANDGIVQVKSNGTSAEMWFRPNNSAVSYNSNYWSRIIQANYSFGIYSGSYQTFILASGNGGGNGAIITFTGGTGVGVDAITINGPTNYGRIALTTYGASPITLNGGNILIGTTTDAGYKLDVNGTVRTGNLTIGSILIGDVGGTRVFNTAGLTIDYGTTYTFNITGTSAASITPAGILTLKGVTHNYSVTEVYKVQKTANVGHLQINFDIIGSDAVAGYNYGTKSGNVRIYPGEQSFSNGYGNVILAHDGTAARGYVGIGTTNPTSKLTIGGVLASGFGLELNEGTYRGSFTATNGGTYVQGYGNGLHLGASGNNTIKLTWDDKVGIGTLSPSAKTHIVGLGSSSSTTSLLIQNSSGASMLQVRDDNFTVIGPNGLAIDNFNCVLYRTSFNSQSISFHGSRLSFADATGFVFSNDYISTPAASAIFDIQSTAKGFLQPRLTTTQKNAISTPATGLQVYDSTLNKNALYNGSVWQSIATETWVTSQAYVPQARTLTINGTTYDLSANRSWTIATTTPGGSNTQFQYNSSGTLAGASALTYNSATNRVGINQASPGYDLDVNGQVRVQDKLRVGTVNSGNGVVHMSSTATINPSATTIVWSQNVSVGMCAFIEYYILNNNTTTDQRAGTIMVTWNQSGTPTIAHTETTTPDIGSTTPVVFTSSLVGSDARINAVNASSAPYTIVMNYRYF